MTRARTTRQGEAVQAALTSSGGFRSAQDVYAELRLRGDPVGLTTVYRHLSALAAAGDLDVLHTPDGQTLYRRCGEGHHHHLVCRACGRTVEVEGREIERWTQRVAAEQGFRDVDHTVEVFGTCADCAARG
jgi:Fur family transcriptional regulator, ferric uptake regulator